MSVYLGTKPMSVYEGGQRFNLTNYKETSITPGVEDITIPAKSLLKNDLVIKGDTNIKEENIKKGVTLFGKTGTYGPFPNGTEWTQSNITSNTFYSVYNANGIWVACNFVPPQRPSYGLYYSIDGKTWTQSNITSGVFYSVYYANNIWVACSYTKGLYYSIDGKTWTQSNITNISFYCAYNANGIWVAGSYDGNGLYYSTDGKEWTQSDISNGSFSCIYNANGIWIAAECSKTIGILYSIDGMIWTKDTTNLIGTDNFMYIYNANGIWVAGSNSNGLYYSLDGKEWAQSNITSGRFNCIYNANGIWVAGSYSNGLYYSIDGMTWTQSNITNISFSSIYNANGIWVAGSGSKGLYYSTNGKTWTQSNITSSSFYCVYNANGIWVAGNYNGLYYSVTWESPSSGGEVTNFEVLPVTWTSDNIESHYNYNETLADSVTVNLNMSFNGMPIRDTNSNPIMLQKITVPYSSLSDTYSLDTYDRYSTENGKGEYVDNTIIERPTLLHLILQQVIEYYGADASSDPSSVFADTITGLTTLSGETIENTNANMINTGDSTSQYYEQLLGFDENFMYLRNHRYPLMSEGWGSSSDYILLSDNDTLDIAFFTDWSAYQSGKFLWFPEDIVEISKKVSSFITGLYSTTMNGNCDKLTGKSNTTNIPEIISNCSDYTINLYDSSYELIEIENLIQCKDSSITLNITKLDTGEYYLIAMNTDAGAIECYDAPAIIKINIIE